MPIHAASVMWDILDIKAKMPQGGLKVMSTRTEYHDNYAEVRIFKFQLLCAFQSNFHLFLQVFIALGILVCYIMGRSLEWNWLALAACLFLFPFVFGLYFIPESPPWLIYNDEEDLAYKSMLMVRGEEYDASIEICRYGDFT